MADILLEKASNAKTTTARCRIRGWEVINIIQLGDTGRSDGSIGVRLAMNSPGTMPCIKLDLQLT